MIDIKIENVRNMMYGLDTPVQHGNGRMAPAVNLDNAAICCGCR